MSVLKNHHKDMGTFTTKPLSAQLAEDTNKAQCPPPASNTDIVTNSYDLQKCSESNTPSAPFKKGQRVFILSLRKSREKYHGRVGIVAAVVKHHTDRDWTVYLTFPPRNQAVAFLASELALEAEDCLLVGGAA